MAWSDREVALTCLNAAQRWVSAFEFAMLMRMAPNKATDLLQEMVNAGEVERERFYGGGCVWSYRIATVEHYRQVRAGTIAVHGLEVDE